MEESEFIKGFNAGYLIARYNPIISKGIGESTITSPFIVGLRQGIEEGTLDLAKTRKDELSKIRLKSSKIRNLDR